MYSALKREGRPLYELARQGIEVERAARTIEIRRLDLVERVGTTLDLVCECAKGTYIRVLGEDIARALGTCGHLIRLRRTWVEPFRIRPMVSSMRSSKALPGCQQSAGARRRAAQALPQARVTAAQVGHLRHGQPLEAGAAAIDGAVTGRARARLRA